MTLDTLGAVGRAGRGGAEGCVAADAVRWTRLNVSMGGGCADPRAANYDAAAFPRRDGAAAAADVAADGDADGCGAARASRASGTTLEAPLPLLSRYGACLYVGGRGLTRSAWSLMEPGYRHAGWAKDLAGRLSFATGARCGAPALNSTAWHACKDGRVAPPLRILPKHLCAARLSENSSPQPSLGLSRYCDFHSPCVAASGAGAAGAAPVTSVYSTATLEDAGAVSADAATTTGAGGAAVWASTTTTTTTRTVRAVSVTTTTTTTAGEPVQVGETTTAATAGATTTTTTTVAGASTTTTTTTTAGDGAAAAALGSAGSFCCLTNDHWGCDPAWDSGELADGDEDGGAWVTVLKQDTDEYLFAPDEFRKNAHGGAGQTTYAILDELEGSGMKLRPPSPLSLSGTRSSTSSRGCAGCRTGGSSSS